MSVAPLLTQAWIHTPLGTSQSRVGVERVVPIGVSDQRALDALKDKHEVFADPRLLDIERHAIQESLWLLFW